MTEAREAIEAASKQFMNAILIGDTNVERIVALYTEDARFMPAGGLDLTEYNFAPHSDDEQLLSKRFSIEYIRNYWQHVHAQLSLTKHGYHRLAIDLFGNIAHEIGAYQVIGWVDSDVSPEVENGIYFIVWRKENDKWKIAVHIMNSGDRPSWVTSYLSQ